MEEQVKLTIQARLHRIMSIASMIYMSFDSTNDGATNYDRVLFVPSASGKNAAAKVADLTSGQWGNVKVKLSGGP